MSGSYFDDLRTLRHNKRYRIKTNKGDTSTIIICCRRCRARWSWPAGKRMGVGVHLELLNHAVGHESKGATP